MKKFKWILVLLIVLISMPSYASEVVLEKEIDILKFEDIEDLIKKQNPTIKINENTKKNLGDSIDALRDARYDKRDLEDAIDGIEDAIDGMYEAIKAQDAMINGLNQMLIPGAPIPGQGPGPQGPEKAQEKLEDGEDGQKDQSEESDEPGSMPGPGPAPGPEQVYENLVGVQIGTLQFVKGLYKSNIASLEQNVEALENQLKEFDKLPGKEMELEKAILQIDMGEESIIWGGQNLYLGYSGLQRQRRELVQNLQLLDDQIDIMLIQKELGMLIQLDLNSITSQREEMILGIKTLDNQIKNLGRELNLILGQDINKELRLEDDFTIDEKTIARVDYKDDLKTSKENSYSIELKDYDYNIQSHNMYWADKHGSSDEYRAARRDLENARIGLEEEREKVELSFAKAYQELQNKIEVLKNEQRNLEFEEEKYNAVELKYELGMLSKMELKQAISEYNSRKNKVQIGKQDVFQSLLQYQSLLRGMDFIQ